MNRPKMGSYDLSTKFTMCEFIRDLEKYCNELEQSNKSLSNAYDDCLVTLHFWEEECCKYRKALDKACMFMTECNNDCMPNCPFRNEDSCSCKCNDENTWKVWLLKDE